MRHHDIDATIFITEPRHTVRRAIWVGGVSVRGLAAVIDKTHAHLLIAFKQGQSICVSFGTAFTMRNPNKVRSLIGAFAMGNPVHFHRADGQGYAFLANQIIELDKSNPTLASRLVGPLLEWEKYDTSRQQLMVGQLVRVLHVPDLSPTTKERVAKGVKVAHDKGITEEGKAALNAMKATEGTAADVTAANVPLSQEEEEIRQALLKAKGEFLVTIPEGAQALEAVGQ